MIKSINSPPPESAPRYASSSFVSRNSAARPLRHHAAAAEHITAIGNGQHMIGHLIDDQQVSCPRRAAVANCCEQFRCDRRAPIPSDGSSSSSISGPRQQAARDRQHLLLAARQQTGGGVQARPQPRKSLQHRLDLGAVRNRGGGWRRGEDSRRRSDAEIPAGLRAPESARRAPPDAPAACCQVLAVEADRAADRDAAGRSSAFIRVDLPAPLGPSTRDGLAAADLQADVVEHRQARRSRPSSPLTSSNGAPAVRAATVVRRHRRRRDRQP